MNYLSFYATNDAHSEIFDILAEAGLHLVNSRHHGELLVSRDEAVADDHGEIHYIEDVGTCPQCGSVHVPTLSIRYIGSTDDTGEHRQCCSVDCLRDYARDEGQEIAKIDDDEYQVFDTCETEGVLLAYNTLQENIAETTEEAPFLVGMEVEKEDADWHTDGEYETNILANANEHGWLAVSDGSLDCETGFELVSPAYNLTADGIYGRRQMELAINSMAAIDADTSHRCGGHLTVSAKGLSGPELARRIEPFFPMIFAMFPSRLTGEYANPCRQEQATNTGYKFRAINTQHNRVEFRIFTGVRNRDQLIKRIDMLRELLRCILADCGGYLSEAESRDEVRRAIERKDSPLRKAINNLCGTTALNEQGENISEVHRMKRYISFLEWWRNGNLDSITQRYVG